MGFCCCCGRLLLLLIFCKSPALFFCPGQSYPKPSISVVPSKIVPLGGNATIRCKVRSEDYAQATFVLFRELDSSLHASVVKKSEWNEVAFFFANVKLSDGGNYRCRYCFNSFSGDSCSRLSDRVKVKIRGESWLSQI